MDLINSNTHLAHVFSFSLFCSYDFHTIDNSNGQLMTKSIFNSTYKDYVVNIYIFPKQFIVPTHFLIIIIFKNCNKLLAILIF